MAANKEYFRLPDGKTTTSVNKYISVWRKLGRDVCAVLGKGHVMYAFDGGLSIRRPKPSYQAIHIDSDVALAIQKMYLENKFFKKYVEKT